MGFVKTAEEIARIRAVNSNPHFVNAEMFSVSFLTDPATVAGILPPGFEPADRPVVTAMVGRWQSNCVADYEGGAVYFAGVKYGDYEADYCIAMYMSTDAAIIWGREMWGEPKKQGSMGLNRQATKMCGWIERQGVRLIEIKADLTTDLGPTVATGKNFNIKALPATNGDGLEDDAILTLVDFKNDLKVNWSGKNGSVTLRGTVHDPLDEIEVKEVLGASYFEGDMDSHPRSIARISAEQYLPYYYGRVDDWSLLNTEDTLKF